MIEMHPETKPKISIFMDLKEFVDGSVCYYQVYVPETSLETETSRYMWELEYISLKSVVPTLGYGTNLLNMNSTISDINEGNHFYFYTQNQLFLTFTGDQKGLGAEDPSFKVKILLKSYLEEDELQTEE